MWILKGAPNKRLTRYGARSEWHPNGSRGPGQKLWRTEGCFQRKEGKEDRSGGGIRAGVEWLSSRGGLDSACLGCLTLTRKALLLTRAEGLQPRPGKEIEGRSWVLRAQGTAWTAEEGERSSRRDWRIVVLTQSSSHILHFGNLQPKPKSTEGMVMQTGRHFYTVCLMTLVADMIFLCFLSLARF